MTELALRFELQHADVLREARKAKDFDPELDHYLSRAAIVVTALANERFLVVRKETPKEAARHVPRYARYFAYQNRAKSPTLSDLDNLYHHCGWTPVRVIALAKKWGFIAQLDPATNNFILKKST